MTDTMDGVNACAHELLDYFYTAPGAVMIGCTKCPYWEPAAPREGVTVTLYDAEVFKDDSHD